MRLYTSILLFLLLSVGITVNSFGIEYQTSKAYTALNGQVSDAGAARPSDAKGRR